MWYNTPHWKIIALICCARRSPKVTLITVFVRIVVWKQARWPPLFITLLISPCLVTSTYQVSSEIYGGIFYYGNTLIMTSADQRYIAAQLLYYLDDIKLRYPRWWSEFWHRRTWWRLRSIDVSLLYGTICCVVRRSLSSVEPFGHRSAWFPLLFITLESLTTL